MNPKPKRLFLAVLAATTLAACGGGSGSNDSDGPDANSDLPEIPSTYNFDSPFTEGESSVGYTGQTKRHILISDLTAAIRNLDDTPGQNVVSDLNFFFDFDSSSSDTLEYGYSLNGETVVPGPTYGDIASGKSLVGKIAGNDPGLINDEFFGWEDGMDASPTPEELVGHFFASLEQIASDGATDQITVAGGTNVDIDVNYVSNTGLDYAQLVQKFLLGAVTFSQGTGDYLQTNFSENNDVAVSGKHYSFAQHKWDEAFGYFGAARDYNDYEDDEIAGKGGRPAYENGYFDSNNDGDIDLRSEINIGNATNCAKRDRGAEVETDFTKEAFDAFLLGRTLLNQDSNLTETQLEQLQTAALTASVTWEKCIAATAIHYINDTLDDMDAFTNDNHYADLAAFKNHAKHWGEMKGFALGLQFNPDSPFRADAEALNKLKTVLSLMGDAPVLADGTQNGSAFPGGVDQYRDDLLEARDILEEVYQFNSENVENW